MNEPLQTSPRRPWPWLVKKSCVGCLVLALVLAMACVTGPDPRYLLLQEGMTQSEVQMVMGRPDIYDFHNDPEDEQDWPGWYYTYDKSEIVLLWGPDGRLHKKIFLHSFWRR